MPWWEAQINLPEPFGMSELVLSSFLRIVTNRRVFKIPTPMPDAMRAVEAIRLRANHRTIRPGERHFDIFTELCVSGNAKGKLVADAYLAAIAIEQGCQWVSYDRDFSRFPSLDWIHPQGGIK